MIDRCDLWHGLRVVWRHVPRGGYGVALRIPATVRGLTPKRVTIEIETARGKKTIAVSHASLYDVESESDGGRSWLEDVDAEIAKLAEDEG